MEAFAGPETASITICQIWMVTKDDEKLFLKVEKGHRPRIRVHQESHKALVTIPYDQVTKWPQSRVRMNGGLTVFVQRLEQQYKVTVQHNSQRKADISIYVNALGPSRDIKTSVRHVNTQLKHVGIAGPNLELTGRVKATKVTFESTIGALHTNAKLSARSVFLNAQSIFIKSEAIFSCAKLKMSAHRVQLDGRLCRWEKQLNKMDIFIDAALLHVGIDGAIGTSKPSANDKIENSVDVLLLRLTGSLANYGRITSLYELQLCVEGNMLSLQNGWIDSASRGYAALKQLKGITSVAPDCLPTSSTLSSAIIFEKPGTVAQLLEDGVDLNDTVNRGDTSENTPMKIAAKRYNEIRLSERKNHLREKITLIQALINTHKWRRGVITSNTVYAKIGKDCEDCSQFRATNLTLIISGTAKCEANSIWSSGNVTLTTVRDLVIEGQVKHSNLKLNCSGNVLSSEESIISLEQWAKVTSSSFSIAGILSVGEQFVLNANSARFLAESYLEADQIEGTIKENCYISGIWETRSVSLTLNENLVTSLSGKVYIDDTAFVDASSFCCCGTWKIKSAIQLTLRGSASFSATSKLSTILCKLMAEGHCTIAGHMIMDNLVAYVRNDMITTPTGKVTAQVNATIAAGIYRNDGIWNADGNVHMHVACFEQSENAIVFVKDTLSMVLYDFSEERSQGRIVANCFVMKSQRRTRFDGYIRVNRIEISAPYVNESSCTIGGQLEVLNGPLLVKGHSEDKFSERYSPHPFSGFILEGQLKAEAVIAPFLALTFTESSYSLLSGMESVAESPFRTLISCAFLQTKPTSLIVSISEDHYAEAILCSAAWIHEGQIKFHGDTVHIVAGCFLNRGRLTSDNKLQNHMHEVTMFIESGFQNEAVFSANRISITGNGEFINKNRVFAGDSMDIHLPNYHDKSKQMLCEKSNTKLLSAGTHCGKLNGTIEAKGHVESINPRIINKLNFDKQLHIAAHSQLVIGNDVIDSAKNFSLSARDAITFKSLISVDQLELRVGTAYSSEIVISENSSVKAQQFRVSGTCKFLTLLIDGELSCKTLLLDVAVKHLKLIGKGTFHCKSSCNSNGNALTISISEMYIAELIGSQIIFEPRKTLTLSPPDNKEAVTVYADCCHIRGELLLEHKIILKTHNGLVNIDGQLMGTCSDSEMCIECSEANIFGILANLDFFECYAKKGINTSENVSFKNLRNIAMESGYIQLCGKLSECGTLIATADEIDIHGEIRSHLDNCSYSFYAKKIIFNGETTSLSRLELNAAYISICGKFTDVTLIDIDAELINFSPKYACCERLYIIAHTCILSGFISIKNVEVWSLAAVLLRTDLSSTQSCSVVSPVVLALNYPLNQMAHLSALLYVTDGPTADIKTNRNNEKKHRVFVNKPMEDEIISPCESLVASEKTLIRISFISEAVITATDCNALMETMKKIANIFRLQTIMYSDLSDTLEVVSQLPTITVTLSATSIQREVLLRVISELEQATFVFDLSKVVTLFYDPKTNSCFETPIMTSPRKTRKFDAALLYKLADRFQNQTRKYSVRTPQGSVEDIGYASRSSSEDIGEQNLPAHRERGSSSSTCKFSSDEDVIQTTEDENLKAIGNEQHPSDNDIEDGKVCHDDKTNYVMNGERKVPIAALNFNTMDIRISRPTIIEKRKTCTNVDLIVKKIKLKAAVSNSDLRSYGSESSLASFDTTEMGTPMRFIGTPVKRSLIPRSAHVK